MATLSSCSAIPALPWSFTEPKHQLNYTFPVPGSLSRLMEESHAQPIPFLPSGTQKLEAPPTKAMKVSMLQNLRKWILEVSVLSFVQLCGVQGRTGEMHQG